MESSIGTRKRKQRPSESDPFSGIFTRSRSQIYFHRHRSGYARPDSNRSRNIIKSLAKQQQLEASVEVSVDPVTNQVSVKDLRARRVFSPATDASNDVVSIGEVDLEPDCKKDDVNPRVSVSEADLGVLEPVVDLKDNLENNVTEGEGVVVVQMTPVVVNEVADIKGVMNMNKSQQLVTSLRGRRKVFKSPTSFNYRRLLPYLMDSGSDGKHTTQFHLITCLCINLSYSSSFEIIEATLPKSVKSSNPVSNTVALKDEDIDPLSNSSKLADGLMNNAKSGEQQLSNGANAGLVSTVESSDVVQKTQEEVVNDTLKCEQMTPPSDSITYNKSKTDDVSSGVLVKPTSTRKLLQTPTSFSHRRLLPFLMSVAEDYSCPLNDNKSLNLEKAIEQNQQPPTQPLHQNEKSTTTDEASNSPTSTLIPVDISTDITKPVTLVSNDNISDANTPNKEGSGSVSQLEVNLQVEAVKTDSCIKTEQSPPKVNLKLVEKPTFNPAPLCIGTTSEAAPLCVEATSNAAPLCIEATSKAAPLCIEQSDREDHLKIVKESPTANTSPLCIEQSYSKVKESPQHYQLQVPETQGEIIRSGILKRNPRGCRGICNCLNCTSFRLHAERSFEFSKNQMHDAEEVALELINDLSYLRNILETTSTLDADKEKLVKDACAKALYKEQEARARLAQMNEDLSFHCRSMVSLSSC
ncbi:hypothetical protein HanHA300_Chr02g0071251 [Helianthus annuus]|nr:hypothetical protein HanHA300_Chr02g0071251 [Helianthus annuus]KAJ0787616.1 hypothetical protein HanOQP8_Chr02g0084371 [Helianthus annuus]